MKNEKEIQEDYYWDRGFFSDYNSILGYYQAKTCIDLSIKGSLLDLACGEGLLTEFFVDHFDKVVGLDASSIHLEKAKKRLPKVEFIESLIEDYSPKELFDNIFLILILEHVESPIELLKKVSTFLEKGGQIIIQVPNETAINRRLAVKMGTLESCDELSPFDINIAGHRRSYNIETLRHDIEAAGLKVTKTGGIFYKMLSTPQMDWFLKNGTWDAGHGWGRTGVENIDWKKEFCRACYEIGLEQPEDCNVIYACVKKQDHE